MYLVCCLFASAMLQAVVQPDGPTVVANGEADASFETRVIWECDDVYQDAFNGKIAPRAYNGNAYMVVVLSDLQTKVVKIPLDGGPAQMMPLMPGHKTGSDPHRYYAIDVDTLGYIHVSGDMHSSPFVKHWISKKPEDISEVISATSKDGDKGPQGLTVTYPHFYRSPDGELFFIIRESGHHWGLCLSRLDTKTQTWTVLGADIPKADGGKHRIPFTAWENNGEGGPHGYMQPHHSIHWGRDGRMHVAFALLNKDTPSAQEGHKLSDVIYAYSDDHGTSFHRGDGSEIKLPMRADAGPYQGDVVYAGQDHVGAECWLKMPVLVRTDAQNRPVVSFDTRAKKHHSLVLEKGKWTEQDLKTAQAGDPAAVQDGAEDEEGEGDEMGMAGKRPHLPYGIHHLDVEYLRDTGNYLYVAEPAPSRRAKNPVKLRIVLSKPVLTR